MSCPAQHGRIRQHACPCRERDSSEAPLVMRPPCPRQPLHKLHSVLFYQLNHRISGRCGTQSLSLSPCRPRPVCPVLLCQYSQIVVKSAVLDLSQFEHAVVLRTASGCASQVCRHCDCSSKVRPADAPDSVRTSRYETLRLLSNTFATPPQPIDSQLVLQAY